MKERIKQSIYNNITVFDSEGRSGYLTPRLIKLIQFVHRHEYKEKIKYIYIDPFVKLSNDPVWLENQLKVQYKVIGLLSNEVLKNNCTLGMGKKYFILAVGDKNTTLGMC